MACESQQAQVDGLKGRITAAQNELDRTSDPGIRTALLAALQELQSQLTDAEDQLANCLKQTVVPTFLVQARDPRANMPPCLTPELRATIQSSIAGQFQALFPGAYVDNDCVGDPTNEFAAFGVWTSPASPLTDAVKQQYHAMLATDIGRTSQETIAFYLNVTLFEGLLPSVETSVKQSLPTSTNLTAPITFDFKSPDTIVTTIKGVDTEPTPDVSFTLTITEKFSGGPGITNWDVVTSQFDKDELGVILAAVVSAVVGVAGAFFSLATLGLTVPLTVLTGYQAWKVIESSASGTSIGGALAELIMPPSIPIPGGQKLPIEYALRTLHHVQDGVGVEIDDTGMYVGGFLLPPVPRQPAITLTGNTDVSLHVGGPDATDAVSITSAVDLRGTLLYAWTVNGKARKPETAETSLILSFNPSIGPFGTQTVEVTVTDEDGLSASATLVITVSSTQPRGPGSGNPVHPA